MDVAFVLNQGTFKRIVWALWDGSIKGTNVSTFVDESLHVDNATNIWWIDSGATIHVVNSMQRLSTKWILRRGERRIRVANGMETDAKAIGNFDLILHTGFALKLTNVLYVPSMERNLVSVSCLDDDGYHCNFGDGRCIIMYNNKDFLSCYSTRTTLLNYSQWYCQ